MRVVVIIFFITAFGEAQAQDFLHFKTGEVKEVKIFYLSVEKDLVGYEADGKKTYQVISSLQKYELNSLLTPAPLTIDSISRPDLEAAGSLSDNRRKYDFGKWSISTDLLSLLAVSRNSIVTVEPEYEVNSKISVRMPLRIGLSNHYFNQYSDYSVGDFWSSYESGEPPVGGNFNNLRIFDDHLLMEVGVIPKYYFYGKSARLFSPYVGLGLKAGLWHGESINEFVTIDTVTSFSGNTYWEVTNTNADFESFNTLFVSTEVLLGLDIVFSRALNLTIEGGLDINLGHSKLQEGTINMRYFGGNYDQVQAVTRAFYGNNTPRFRALLTYRFNGSVRE